MLVGEMERTTPEVCCQRIAHPPAGLPVRRHRDRGAVECVDGAPDVGERLQGMDRQRHAAGHRDRAEHLQAERSRHVDDDGAVIDPFRDRGGHRFDRAVGHGHRDHLRAPNGLGELDDRHVGEPPRGSRSRRLATGHRDDRVTGAHPTDRDGGSHRAGPDDRDVHPATEREYGNVEIHSNGPTGVGTPSGRESGRTDPFATRLTVPSVNA